MLHVLSFFALFIPTILAQGDHLGLSNGYTKLSLKNFDASIVKDAQVLVSLKAKGGTFDFLPFSLIADRAGNSQYHWGDVTFRYRNVGTTAWTSGDSSTARQAVAATTGGNSTYGTVLAASNMAKTLPAAASTVGITRQWLDVDGDLGVTWTLTNTGKTAIELGSLGFPTEVDNIFTWRTASAAQKLCSFADPYIGMGGGYVRLSPINGNGAALVVTPLGNTPLEAYRNLIEPFYNATHYDNQEYEGNFEWQTLTKAWAETEWKAATPWNPPSSKTLAAGESLTFGLRFSLASSIKTIDDAIVTTGTPHVRGIPGYIVPRDLTAQLLVKPGAAGTVTNITIDPAGALTVKEISAGLYGVTPSATAFGRVRLTIAYSKGTVQTVHYYVVKSGPAHIAALGNFLTTEQFFNDTSDPFGRAPSIISYDHEAKKQVLQDARVWIAGLGDEAGSGSFLAAAMKQAQQPAAAEVAKLEAFIDGVMFKTLQPNDGKFKVRKSVFYYGRPGYSYVPSEPWEQGSWDKSGAYATDRGYDYVHVAATYWAMYRVARAYPTLTKHTWDWYLNQGYSTVMALMEQDSGKLFVVGYAICGLMGETSFGEILTGLKREGLTDKASQLEAKFKYRAEMWKQMDDPFGSEMGWDSTGQEGVYYWSKHFGDTALAAKTLGTVLGFQPTVPHWGYNGNARRYWDNLYGGKLKRIERQIHHYGSGLNAQVALAAYRSDPTDNYLLRIGYGGMNGPLSNIHDDGFASASFHSWPETLAWDAYSGDYGPNFVGLTLGTGTYLAKDPDLGLVAYGGSVDNSTEGAVVVSPKDAARRKVFVGPLGVLVEIDAGVIQSFTYKPGSTTLAFTLGQLDGVPTAQATTMWVTREDGGAAYSVTGTGVTQARMGWQIPLGSGNVNVNVVPA